MHGKYTEGKFHSIYCKRLFKEKLINKFNIKIQLIITHKKKLLINTI